MNSLVIVGTISNGYVRVIMNCGSIGWIFIPMKYRNKLLCGAMNPRDGPGSHPKKRSETANIQSESVLN